ncbi:glycosyltransferase [Geothrix campi]|uniref:glycosyltransferase n=1 Tax=Geothrix campi TaxID=2966450 RepID=UPI003CC65C26
MASSNLVIAGNTYLAERAWTAGARRVEILPTVVDLDRYPEPVNSEPQSAGPIRIGWIGSTLNESYLYEISDALARVHRQIAIELVVIGGSANFSIPGVPVRSVQWTQATEVADLADCDIGVMPLPDTPWSWGKCGFKLLQYMGAGLPVVASPIGANCDLVDQGVNGFLAGSPQEWEKSILALAMDGRLRTSMGIQGRRCLVSNYTIQAVAPKLEALLSSLINS